MRWLCSLSALTLICLQAYLWLSDNGHRNTVSIREAVAEVRAGNQKLIERNASLAAEVRNLKTGNEATEERARSDLGMIGEHETFYQVVPAGTTGI